jgi:periplasmic mercuric ion binding protein
VSCKETGSAPKTETSNQLTDAKTPIDANAKLATASFNIDGMTCAIGCAKTIEKELNETQGVKTATVDFDKKTATVEYDTKLQTPEKLVQIVEKTGDGETYKVSNLKNSADKAMLFDQEKEKPESAKKEKVATDKTFKKSEKKQSCSASGKHCSKDEKKETM